MSKKKKTAIALGVLAGIAALFGLAGAAKAADDDEDDGTDKPWDGPDPGLPGKKKKPKTTPNRPTHVNPDDLWIAPDCSDLIIGENWFPDTATPAIRIWVDTGYGRPFHYFEDKRRGREMGTGQVVRGILLPYAPHCVEGPNAFPWWDEYEVANPRPEWDPPAGEALEAWTNEIVSRQEAYERDHPQLTQLIVDLQRLVVQIWNEKNG